MTEFLREEIHLALDDGCGKHTVSKKVDIRFEKLAYDVSVGFRKGTKRILHEVNGRFPAQQLIAIMGPSGAGKSSLLDMLSGYRITGTSGSVLVNRQERNLAMFRRKSCYITQDDRLEPLLTTIENMRVAAGLKLAGNISSAQREIIINDILSTLGLLESASTRSSLLSGGQRKRLSIAMELINNPLVMFLDEPTTGLDSSSCTQIVAHLKKLARQGRTIICTIHQPSASLFQVFDQAYVLAKGQCLYQGEPGQLVAYLNAIKLPCPKYHNPADYVIELASGEYGDDKIDQMIGAIGNGTVTKWMPVDMVQDNVVAVVEESKHETETRVKKKVYRSTSVEQTGSSTVSLFSQTCVLVQRGYIKIKRDSTLTHLRLIANLATGLMLGSIYINSGNDGSRVLDNYALLFATLLHHVMSTMMLTILTFPSEMDILKKEHFNRWYSLKSYYFTVTMLEIPVVVLSCFVFTVVMYFLSDQPADLTRFSMFFGISVLTVSIAQAIGLAIGAVFNVVNGTFIGPTLLVVPMMMFAGFGITVRDLPSYLRWVSYTSYLRYGLEGYVMAIYSMDRATLNCREDDYCHYKYPKKFLEDIDIEGDLFWTDVLALCSMIILVRILAYVLLRWRLQADR